MKSSKEIFKLATVKRTVKLQYSEEVQKTQSALKALNDTLVRVLEFNVFGSPYLCIFTYHGGEPPAQDDKARQIST